MKTGKKHLNVILMGNGREHFRFLSNLKYDFFFWSLKKLLQEQTDMPSEFLINYI
jgi:hypothetical protein